MKEVYTFFNITIDFYVFLFVTFSFLSMNRTRLTQKINRMLLLLYHQPHPVYASGTQQKRIPAVLQRSLQCIRRKGLFLHRLPAILSVYGLHLSKMKPRTSEMRPRQRVMKARMSVMRTRQSEMKPQINQMRPQQNEMKPQQRLIRPLKLFLWPHFLQLKWPQILGTLIQNIQKQFVTTQINNELISAFPFFQFQLKLEGFNRRWDARLVTFIMKWMAFLRLIGIVQLTGKVVKHSSRTTPWLLYQLN